MKIQVDSTIFTHAEGLKIGVIRYDGIETGAIPSMLVGRLQLYTENLNTELQDKQWSDYPGIMAWRQHFKQTGADPARYRPSVEALFRRIKKEPQLPAGNSAIAINNFFSLQYETPLGIYDISNLTGNVTFKIGTAEDTYEGLNGRSNTLKGIITSFDEKGPFGSPYVDSVRTSVSNKTDSALQIIYFHSGINADQASKMLSAISKMFIQIHGGSSSIQLLTKEKMTTEI